MWEKVANAAANVPRVQARHQPIVQPNLTQITPQAVSEFQPAMNEVIQQSNLQFDKLVCCAWRTMLQILVIVHRLPWTNIPPTPVGTLGLQTAPKLVPYGQIGSIPIRGGPYWALGEYAGEQPRNNVLPPTPTQSVVPQWMHVPPFAANNFWGNTDS